MGKINSEKDKEYHGFMQMVNQMREAQKQLQNNQDNRIKARVSILEGLVDESIREYYSDKREQELYLFNEE